MTSQGLYLKVMKINKPLFYILNLTWGLPLTAVGALVSLVLLCAGFKPKRHGGCIYFNLPGNWGGLEMGLFFLSDGEDSYYINCHEYGHAIQNMIFGPLMIPLVTLPSIIRYWYFVWREKRGKTNKPYDSIWFEGQATNWGYGTISQWK